MKFFLIVLFSLTASYNFISAQVFQNKDVKITLLEDHMWVVETFDSTTMYIVEGTKKAMLIDTGTKCKHLDSIVKMITKKTLYVVITHAHGDHDGNIRFFKEIYMHPADTVLLGKGYKGKIHFVKDGDVFDLGDKQIEVSHMPAHTPGSIVLLDKKAGICYGGDAFGSGQVWLQLKPGAPIKTYINSCKKMEDLMANGINKIYCGHYSYPKKAYDKSYMDSMLKLAEALDNGTEKGSKPYPRKIGCKNPMMVTDGEANIVYDPEHIK
jgi:hydroxyacylglutathione hydrolase